MDFKGKLVDKMDNGFCFITKSKKYHLLQKHILRVSCFYKNSLIFTLYTNISLEGLPKCCISVITETKLTKLGMDMDLPKGYKIMWRNEAVRKSGLLKWRYRGCLDVMTSFLITVRYSKEVYSWVLTLVLMEATASE